MPRAARVLPAAERNSAPSGDTLILPFAQRQAQRGFVFTVKGACIELDFAEPVRLRTDDALVLDDGSVVEIVAEPEPLFELRSNDPATIARWAWHLGDRHLPVELKPNRIRVRREPAIETLFQALDAKFVAIEAPFEPEGGAYAVGHEHHDEHHGHSHPHHLHHHLHHRHDDEDGHDHGHHHHPHKLD